MNKNLIILAGVAVVLAIVALASTITPETVQPEDEIHYHAGFQVYKDDVLQDFSGLQYMHLESCTEEEHKEEPSAEEEQLEKAHLHDGIGDVIHVHRENVTWKDFFENIKVDINSEASAYINGKEVENFQDSPINTYDSLVIFEGQNTDTNEKLQKAVSKEHIIETESKSESCGS